MNIHRHLLAFLFYVAAHVVAEEAELSVTVTSGPTECSKPETVSKGKEIGVHYSVYIDDSSAAGTPGELIQSSIGAAGVPYTFTIGKGQVVDGWDEGLIGKCKGAKVTMVTPPAYAYRDVGMYSEDGEVEYIPPGATLKWDIEIVEVAPKAFITFDEMSIVAPFVVAGLIIFLLFLVREAKESNKMKTAPPADAVDKLELQ